MPPLPRTWPLLPIALGGILLALPERRPDASEAPVLVGRVIQVTDGDTIKVQLDSGPIDVRLDSIDAPERNQPYGRESRAALYAALSNRTVELEVVEQDRYSRQVAVVHVEGTNVNAAMVQQGHAWAYREYVKDADYCRWEGAARSKKAGIWALAIRDQTAPWEWRDLSRGEVYEATDYSRRTVEDCIKASGTRTDAAPEVPDDGTCRIKGNIGDSGRIYHIPGSRSYAATRIDIGRGERWFCSVDEAEAAGFRRPRG